MASNNWEQRFDKEFTIDDFQDNGITYAHAVKDRLKSFITQELEKARTEGFSEGKEQGIEQGRLIGYKQGYEDGKSQKNSRG